MCINKWLPVNHVFFVCFFTWLYCPQVVVFWAGGVNEWLWSCVFCLDNRIKHFSCALDLVLHSVFIGNFQFKKPSVFSTMKTSICLVMILCVQVNVVKFNISTPSLGNSNWQKTLSEVWNTVYSLNSTHSKNMHVRCIESKWSIGVNVNVNVIGCLC